MFTMFTYQLTSVQDPASQRKLLRAIRVYDIWLLLIKACDS